MLAVAVDWTQVLIVGVPAYIAAIFAGVATIYTVRVHSQVQTPSGKSLGEVAEYAHDTAIANNLFLQASNDDSRPGETDELKEAGSHPPSVPVEH